MLAFQWVHMLLGLDSGLVKVCMSERMEIELEEESVEVTVMKLEEESGMRLVEETEMELEADSVEVTVLKLEEKSGMRLVEVTGLAVRKALTRVPMTIP